MHELPFRTAGTSGSRVRVEEDGTGLWQVWERQIQQFNRVSSATAAAVAEAHPSPSLLVQVSPQTPWCPVKACCVEGDGREGCHRFPCLKVLVDGASKS